MAYPHPSTPLVYRRDVQRSIASRDQAMLDMIFFRAGYLRPGLQIQQPRLGPSPSLSEVITACIAMCFFVAALLTPFATKILFPIDLTAGHRSVRDLERVRKASKVSTYLSAKGVAELKSMSTEDYFQASLTVSLRCFIHLLAAATCLSVIGVTIAYVARAWYQSGEDFHGTVAPRWFIFVDNLIADASNKVAALCWDGQGSRVDPAGQRDVVAAYARRAS